MEPNGIMLATPVDREELAARVGRGSGFLDVTLPNWWWPVRRPRGPAINVPMLDMGSSRACVLGQLGPRSRAFDPYLGMREQLGLQVWQAQRYGFELRVPCDTHDELNCRCVRSYAVLTEFWRLAILERRSDAALTP